MKVPYFAYGSNLCLPRLRSRVPGVQPIERTCLDGYELRWHKRSGDGSGKCSISPSVGKPLVVYGVLFQIPEEEKHLLDKAEGLGFGYEERSVLVAAAEGRTEAVTYVATSTYIDDALRPYRWYKDIVISGAEAFDLPPDYIATLRSIVAVEDPNAERASQNRAALPCAGLPNMRLLQSR